MKNRNERRVQTLEQGVAILLREIEALHGRISEEIAAPEVRSRIMTPKHAQRVLEVRKALNLGDVASELVSMRAANG